MTKEGCDLNRNFIDFTKPIHDNAGYDELADHLVPRELEGPLFQASEIAIRKLREQNGEVAFQIARKAGQYRHSTGVSFRGFGPSHPRQTLEKIAERFDLKSRDTVVIVDAHTGLSPFGYGELQTEQSSGLSGYERAPDRFGRSVTSPDLGTSTSVPICGSIDEYWQRLLGEKHVYVVLEFGRLTPRAAGGCSATIIGSRKIQMQILLSQTLSVCEFEHYDPRLVDWQKMVLWRSRQVHRQIFEGLGGRP